MDTFPGVEQKKLIYIEKLMWHINFCKIHSFEGSENRIKHYEKIKEKILSIVGNNEDIPLDFWNW